MPRSRVGVPWRGREVLILGARQTRTVFRRRSRLTIMVFAAVVVVLASASVWLFTRSGGAPGAAGGAGSDSRAAKVDRPVDKCAGVPVSAPRELRGMWLTTVRNTDWPSRPGLDEATLKAEFRGWLDLAQRLNHNAIFVQVRPSGDAFWPWEFAPWSDWLTGRRDGVGPGWDPLEFMVEETHGRNMEFHAWFNPYKASQIADPNLLQPDNPLRKHPDWQVTFPATGPDARLYYNPGIPEARTFVEDSVLEAVRRYDIDGVHFDDFFYPYPVKGQDFPDDATFAQFGRGFTDKGAWRRDNVNKLVQEMDLRIKKLKPWVKFGISPFGIWRNDSTDPAGSATRGLQSYDEISVDTRLWVQKGWLDYIVPQLYWTIGFAVADYAKLLPWWSKVVEGTGVQLYIGQADYRVGQPGPWADPGELERQLRLNAHYDVSGSIHFTAKNLRADPLGAVSRYRNALNAGPALVPAMGQLPSHPPGAPAHASGQRKGDAVTLRWHAPGAASFAVYKVDGARANLVGTTRSTTWTDATAGSGKATYCVSALDRSWNEGATSEPLEV
jgi:uncharacterized lipoprotein YddW (UPF0748 family)